MVGTLLSREETNAAILLAFGGKIMLLVANGSGPLSLKRTVSRNLSNPVPRASRRMHAEVALPTLPSELAA
jgi:hypothetical protein